MQKFERTELVMTGNSPYEESKNIQKRFAHFGMKIAMSVAKKIFKEEFDEDDFPIKKVDLQFIQRFEHHLLVSRAGGRNTVSKYVTISKRSCE